MSETQTRYPPRKTVNLYRSENMELWDEVEHKIRSEYDAEDVPVGVVAGQVFAEFLGTDGPLDGDKNA